MHCTIGNQRARAEEFFEENDEEDVFKSGPVCFGRHVKLLSPREGFHVGESWM